MLWIYRLFFLPAMLLAAPFYLRRMLKRGGYRDGFGQRFGGGPALPPKRAGVPRIWLQAVSVGEVLAMGPLLKRLTDGGRAEVYLTTTTSTGYALAREKFAALTIGIGYFPLDWWRFSRRTWNRVQPDLVLLAESELWPEHLAQGAKRKIPVVLVNARLSDRSFRRLHAVRTLAGRLYRKITRILPSSEQDAERFRKLGVPAEKLVTTGNLKFDVSIPVLDIWERAMLRRELGLADNQLTILGSSTWPGEEQALLRLLERARRDGVICQLLLVPRHAERRGEIEALLQTRPLNWHFRSRGQAVGLVDVCVGDTTGELQRLTQVADLVFVGKSLPPNEGGQTPIEAALLEKPILFGPAMSNFRPACEALINCGAALRVSDEVELVDQGLALLRDEKRRAEMAAAACAWHQANTGAMERTLRELERFLPAK
ncbi:MAG TPA: glycosyltransferase N-terminal domain-containing protein [Opitutaceae bacterium]|nr:glycosyltransferase N-terminal domain-containing protein [Opitutaceae bacterium]